MRTIPRLSLLLLLALVASLAAVPAAAHPEHGSGSEDGPSSDDHHKQHEGEGGHLPAGSRNVELVGKIDNLTAVDGGIADVAAFGNTAYLAAFHPECLGRNPGSRGTGVHVVDISNPATPTKIGFLPAEPNSYVGEGVHVIDFGGRQYLLHNNETCDASKEVVSGFSLWDVTNPRAATKVGQYGDVTPEVANQIFHTTHSVQGFVWQGKAYAVAQDNQDLKDVDIFDITPAIRGTGPAVLVWEGGLEDFPAAVSGGLGLGHSVFHHDMQQQVIGGRNMLLVSYWDAGQIQLDISNPAAPVYVGSSSFPSPDLAGFEVTEGNSHQSYWSSDGRYVLSSDEDFSPTRTLCTMGTPATEVSCGEFGWTVPLQTKHPDGVAGQTVFGGSGCVEDVNGNGISDRAEVPAATGPNQIIVFSRGVCFFSIKTETGQMKGYEAIAIGQSHAGARNGLVPDGYLCGGQGHTYTITKSAFCIGHRTMHELFASAPSYTGPDIAAGGDLPAIGTLGQRLSAKGGVFDGWGYLRLHDGTDPDLREIGAYAVPQALDPAYASGFGNLTIHEVKTDPRRGKNLAYASWYDAGLRVLSFGPSGLTEVGHYIAEGGNDFWGVYPLCVGQCLLNDKDQGRGRGNEKRPLLLMSDRDSGLWMFRYTGKE